MIVRCGKSYSSPHLSVDFRPGERLNGTEDLPLFPYVRGMGDRLLRIFEEHPGRFVSSEEINRRMGVSRDAVWI